jgi:uncharacterized protein (TIGR02679 family)
MHLAEIEASFVRLGVAEDLPSGLERLGHPVSSEFADARRARQLAAQAKAAAREAVHGWPEGWALLWVDGVIAAGILSGRNPEEAKTLVEQARLVLDSIGTDSSRVELAARVLGNAHALDSGTPLERCVSRALALSLQAEGIEPGDDPWEGFGTHRSLLAGPAFCWGLSLDESHPLADAVRASNDLGLPYVLTRMALSAYPLHVEAGTEVLVVENPRLVEYAAQVRSPLGVITTNGNPSSTVVEALTQLLRSEATVRYHGDFDAAGLEICGRMADAGLRPWEMTDVAYLSALAEAEEAGVELPVDQRRAGRTPWCPDLAAAFNEQRRIVHEERLIELLIPRRDSVPPLGFQV